MLHGLSLCWTMSYKMIVTESEPRDKKIIHRMTNGLFYYFWYFTLMCTYRFSALKLKDSRWWFIMWLECHLIVVCRTKYDADVCLFEIYPHRTQGHRVRPHVWNVYFLCAILWCDFLGFKKVVSKLRWSIHIHFSSISMYDVYVKFL